MGATRAATLIGFALKANKLRLGIDNIVKAKKRPDVLIVSSDASKNTLASCISFAKKRDVVAISPKEQTIEDLTGKCGCKVIAIYDKNMADGILSDEEFYIKLDS